MPRAVEKTERNMFIYNACQRYTGRKIHDMVKEMFGDDLSIQRIFEIRDEVKARLNKTPVTSEG